MMMKKMRSRLAHWISARSLSATAIIELSRLRLSHIGPELRFVKRHDPQTKIANFCYSDLTLFIASPFIFYRKVYENSFRETSSFLCAGN